MIAIFIMITKVEGKLLLLRARNFSDNLEGLESFSISLLEKDAFLWHRGELKMANAIDNKNERVCFKKPVAEDKLIDSVTSLLNIGEHFFVGLFMMADAEYLFAGMIFTYF